MSNCSESEPPKEQCLEKTPVVITLDPKKKLSKICEQIEQETVNKDQELKVDDEKEVLKSITPEELERLRKIFGPGFLMETEAEKPESALGFIPSNMKAPDDKDILKQRIKNLQKAEEHRIK